MVIRLLFPCTQDVVQAYKSLSKEKEALEASVQALSNAPPQRLGGASQGSKPQGQKNDGEEGKKEEGGGEPKGTKDEVRVETLHLNIVAAYHGQQSNRRFYQTLPILVLYPQTKGCAMNSVPNSR